MNPMRWRILVGGLLILAGVLAMVNAVTGIDLGGFVWAVLFVLGGLAFISVMASNRNHWWAAIPGFTLLGIGALIGLDQIAPRAAEQIGGALVLAGIGLSFLVVYLLNRSFWWAIIPMGVMFSLVALIMLEGVMGPAVIVFFLGLAATSALIALL